MQVHVSRSSSGSSPPPRSTAAGPSQRPARDAAVWSILPAIVLAGIGGGIVYPILPLAGVTAGLSPAFIGLILASNRTSRLAFDPLIGAWVDRLGGRRMILLGLVCEVLVMGIYAEAQPSGHLGLLFLLGRIVWGPAAGLVYISGQTLALHAAGPSDRGRVAGLVRTAQISGQPLGMVVGGALAGGFGDETAFLAGIAAAAVGAVFAWWTIPDLRAPSAHHFEWRSVTRALTRPFVLAVSSMNLFCFFGVQGLLLATLVLMLAARHLSVFGWPAQTTAGVALACFLIASAAATLPVGRLCDRLARRSWIVAAGTGVLIASFALLAFAADPLRLGVALVLMGCGMACFNVPLLALLGDRVPPEMRGSAVGGMQLLGDVGGTLGPIAGTTSLAAWGVAVPYLGTAGLLLVLALPLGLWLVGAEGRLAGADRPGDARGL